MSGDARGRPSPLDMAAPEIREELRSHPDAWWFETEERTKRREQLRDVLVILERQAERYGRTQR